MDDKYIACERHVEGTIEDFGTGNTIEEAIHGFDTSFITCHYELGDIVELGVFERIHIDDMEGDEYSVCESQEWEWMLGDLVHEYEVVVEDD